MMDNHKQAFIEEAAELLTTLESSLLQLEGSPEDTGLIAQVFRALHTIKGSAGMFGFDEITMFTHDIENVFDHVRNGEIPVTKQLIDLTLAARDQIKAMLNESEGHSLIDEDKAKHLIVDFRNIVLNYNCVNEVKQTGERKQSAVSDEAESRKSITYYISFCPGRNIFLSGTNPVLLLNELSALGTSVIIAHNEEIPGLKELNAEECYAYWDIILTTNKGIDTIRDVFIFVEDDCKLQIDIADKTGKLGDAANESVIREYFSKSKDFNAAALLEAVKKTEEVLYEVKRPEKRKAKEKDEKSTENEVVSSIRVAAEKLDILVNLVGELVTVQARLTQTADRKNDAELVSIAEEVERLTWELRDSALNIRMLPIGTTFNKFNRLVRDLTHELKKEVELITDGAETELDKNVIEHLNDPLVHIIRNSIDHGIELPEVREREGKARIGKIHLSASQSGGNVLIKIMDDGAGLNKEAIRAKAVSQGLIAQEAELKDSELFGLIFAAGFSTAQKVTNVSGRGVGMDVVRRAIENLRGTVEVESQPGKGTTITLKLPLTLAIIDGLLVKTGQEFFVLPLSVVEECIELTRTEVEKSHGRHLVSIRGEIVPYIRLREQFTITGESPAIEQIVIISVQGYRVGFVVDSVIGEHQTVLKNLGKIFRHVQGISGATILGDGKVALILDVIKLAQNAEVAERAKILQDKTK